MGALRPRPQDARGRHRHAAAAAHRVREGRAAKRIRSAAKDLLTFVIIGAGPTGVELAGAIIELARITLKEDFRRIDPAGARVILVEAGRVSSRISSRRCRTTH